MNSPLRLAVVGCGAVSQTFHLPAASRCPAVEVVLVMDCDEARCRSAAERFRVPAQSCSLADVIDTADAALVAVPNALHCKVGCELLRAGLPVLLEKPLARTVSECDALLAAADQEVVALRIAMVRRFSPTVVATRALLARGLIGRPRECRVMEGGEFNWPISSPSFLDRTLAGGGVLIDQGVHVLDLLAWLFGDWSEVAYQDNSRGGVESDCSLSVRFGDVLCSVELSRTRNIGPSLAIEGDLGTITIADGLFRRELTIQLKDTPHAIVRGEARDGSRVPDDHLDVFAAQLSAFASDVTHGTQLGATGEQGRDLLQLVEKAYRVRQPMDLPWDILPARPELALP